LTLQNNKSLAGAIILLIIVMSLNIWVMVAPTQSNTLSSMATLELAQPSQHQPARRSTLSASALKVSTAQCQLWLRQLAPIRRSCDQLAGAQLALATVMALSTSALRQAPLALVWVLLLL